MNTFVIEEFFVNDGNACNFYTVRLDDNDTSETDKFYDEFFHEDHEFFEDMKDIHSLIEELAESGTSIIRRTRDEARVFALPPQIVIKECAINIFGNNLRLYYVELAADVVVLLGGGIAHHGPKGQVPMQFHEAQSFAKKIIDSKNLFFEVSDGKILPLANEEIIIN